MATFHKIFLPLLGDLPNVVPVGEGAMPVKCALVITPEKVQVASPNADNKKWLDL